MFSHTLCSYIRFNPKDNEYPLRKYLLQRYFSQGGLLYNWRDEIVLLFNLSINCESPDINDKEIL